MTKQNDVTRLVVAAGAGDREAYSVLLSSIYEELRGMAAARMRHERSDHTLQPTALVNEAYLRLTKGDVEWEGRRHFFGAAAEAMRRILVEHARGKAARKRGGDFSRITLGQVDAGLPAPEVDILDLDSALDELRVTDARAAQVVELRFFAGLSVQEAAEVLEASRATVKRDWTFAKAWLLERMGGTPGERLE